MQLKAVVACASAAILAVGIACSTQSSSPVSPTAAQPGLIEAAPDGSTLKVTAPTPVSPVNNAQPEGSVVLIASKATGKFQDVTPSYEFEIFRGNTRVYTSGVTGGAGSGPNNVSHTPNVALDFDQPHTWRVRAVFAGAVGPWSSNATFRAPIGGYIRGNEIFDPLSTGQTVGDISGPTQFIPGEGLRLLDHSSFVTYRLPQNLQEGEFSLMIRGADEGNPGDKAKILSMQEGPNIDDITTDDYRMTAELRGRDYGAPGAVTFRIIPGDGEPQDGHRVQLSFSSSRWYFWRFTWRTNFARLEVKEDSPRGQSIYDTAVSGWTHPYRPDPHFVHLGSPAGRAGLIDATHPGGIYKNVWVSSRPRPAFPGE
jgi:hypothetical protein